MSYLAGFSHCWLALFEVVHQYIYFQREKKHAELSYYFKKDQQNKGHLIPHDHIFISRKRTDKNQYNASLLVKQIRFCLHSSAVWQMKLLTKSVFPYKKKSDGQPLPVRFCPYACCLTLSSTIFSCNTLFFIKYVFLLVIFLALFEARDIIIIKKVTGSTCRC